MTERFPAQGDNFATLSTDMLRLNLDAKINARALAYNRKDFDTVTALQRDIDRIRLILSLAAGGDDAA